MTDTHSRRLCVHAEQDGEGMHWLQPGEQCDPIQRERLAIGRAHQSAAWTTTTVGMALGMWAGRGDWAALSETARAQAGNRALTELDEAIGQLGDVRARLIEALRPASESSTHCP